jgi:hypothetical protein
MPGQNGNGDAAEAEEEEEEEEEEERGAAADDSYEPSKRRRVAPRQWAEGGSGRGDGKGKGGRGQGKKGRLQVHGRVEEPVKAPASAKPAKGKVSKGASKQEAGGAPLKKKKWCVRASAPSVCLCVPPVLLSQNLLCKSQRRLCGRRTVVETDRISLNKVSDDAVRALGTLSLTHAHSHVCSLSRDGLVKMHAMGDPLGLSCY